MLREISFLDKETIGLWRTDRTETLGLGRSLARNLNKV